MKTKKVWKTLVAALAVVGALTLCAKALDTVQTISATLNRGITVQYNGQVQTMKDATGNTVYPITYNNTNYLPVRAIADMLGLEVGWDSATQTITLGASADGTNLLESYKPYTSYYASLNKIESNAGVVFVQNQETPTSIGGENVSSWVLLRSSTTDRGDRVNNKASEINKMRASFNLGGKYSSISFKAYTNYDTTLTVSGDNGAILAQYDLKGGQAPQTFTVDLAGTSELTFERGYAPSNNAQIVYSDYAISTYIFDAMMK